VWNPGPTPAERRVVVVCTGSHAAFLHDPTDGRILDVLLLDSEPADLEIDQEGGRAFVSCRGDNTVVEIALGTFRVTDRFPIPCGQRPGPLHLDRGAPEPGDERLLVASIVTGNNSIPFPLPQLAPVGVVLDLALVGLSLPDEDVFRIDPALAGAAAVTPVARNAGSLVLELGRNPLTDEVWILSSESNNKGTQDTEPEVQGEVVVNQLKRVAGLGPTGGMVTAGAGQDLDLVGPPSQPYDAARSVNQARTLAFQADGEAFVASPMSDVVAHLDASGNRIEDYALPRRAQCYALRAYAPDDSLVLALCLGSMTIEVFAEGTPTPIHSLPLGNDPTPSQVRRGRDIMLDGQISEFGRSSCFACHEGGRSDQLGWSIAGDPVDLKDVMVTQSLLSIEDTFPHHWRGERDLTDFRKAFVGLLGAPAALEPDEAGTRDVNTFMRSLKAPANPLESFRRVLDDRISPKSPDGFSASAVRGQDLFHEVENFNSNTCAECHTASSGSNNNMVAEVLGAFVPRAQELEIAHLRQLQHKGLDTFVLTADTPNGPVTLEVNENGFGATHNGALPSVFRFIFDTAPFVDALNDQERRDIFEFVEQFDQGIAPGAHWTAWYRQGSGNRVEQDIEKILIQGAESDWLDVVVFGRFHDGTALREARWLYDAASDLFVTDDALLPDTSWDQFKTATQAGLAENAFMGVPWGNGERIAFDPDADDLRTGAELALGTDPWNPHSDADRWPDGYEVENLEDPLVAQADPGDEAFPAVDWVELDSVTARTAKGHVRFSEDVTYVIAYSLPGGPSHEYRRDHFVRADTFVLTHSEPSAPIASGNPPPLHEPTPDGASVFTATITLTDRAGRVTGPQTLDLSFTPLAAQGQLGLIDTSGGAFPPLGSFVHVGAMSATVLAQGSDFVTARVTIEPDVHYRDPLTLDYHDADGRVVVCTIAVEDPATGALVQSGLASGPFAFTSSPPSVDDFPLWQLDENGVPIETTFVAAPGIPGPFVLCPPSQNGSTQFTFTQTGLSFAGQKVVVAVQGILIPLQVDDGMGGTKTVQWTPSLFHMQPLLTEADAVDLTGPEFEGTTEVTIPF
jgi:hypothetical protein